MGIVNRTPDSFFDGGALAGDDVAHEHAAAMYAAGADILDFGAESTRPGAPRIDAATQIARLGDSIARACALGATVSIDTTDPEVAAHAIDQGARIVNSVSLDPEGQLANVVAAHPGTDLVLTHCRGATNAMEGFSRYADKAYEDVVSEVADEWVEAAERACAAGVAKASLVFDPGLGFTKNAAQSLTLAAQLPALRERLSRAGFAVRILVGPSRKSYIAHSIADAHGTAPCAPSERLGGSIAAALACARGGADVLRVHDVHAVRQALDYDALHAAAASARTQAPRSQASPPNEGAARV